MNLGNTNTSGQRRTIVVSAINFYEGGPLSILKDCLRFLNGINKLNYKVIALVHKNDIFDKMLFSNIEFLEFPQSRKSYFYRLYYEYYFFKKFADRNNVFLWLSLHDITPRLNNIRQAVYCHNPSPFNSINISDVYLQPTQLLFRFFYKYLYWLNIKSNIYIIVQQAWIKDRFNAMFGVEKNRIIVAPPQMPAIPLVFLERNEERTQTMFFFPAFPRPFKNIEVICEAVAILTAKAVDNFKVMITINGRENNYSKRIVNLYSHLSNIEFIGLLSREEVYERYSKTDCLIFPSKLETWGLPISEFKQFDKPILVADLPYAKEAIGNYNKAKFFHPTNANELATYMENLLSHNLDYSNTQSIIYPSPFAADWNELFSILLND